MFKIPSIFTAIDRYTAPVMKMKVTTASLTANVQAFNAKSERTFRKLTPVLSQTQKEFFQFAKSAAIATAIIGGITFSTGQLKAYETQVASFRTIVSDLSNKDFEKFKNQIGIVAKETRRSTVEVAESFERIAGLNAEFARTAEGIGAISKASIILARASGDDLNTSAESLVGIMNQFSLQANDANRAINVLAAGQAVGAASITQTAESFKNFGSVASSANITLEESVALIQTVGKFSLFGAEAGTKLRGSVLRLQRAGLGYASGQFNINDALEEAVSKMNRLRTAKQKDAFLNKTFGAENVSTGKILLNNIDAFRDFTRGVTGTSEAQKAAKINSQTLTVALSELQNAWVNIITTSNRAGSALSTVKKVVVFLTNNLETIVSVGSKVLLFFAAWKLIIIVTNAALVTYNTVLGISYILMGKSALAIRANAVALAAYKTVVGIVTAVQWLWNTALTAGAIAMQLLMSPITLIILAIVALIALVTLIVKKWNQWGAALALFMGPLGLIISLIQAFRRNWDLIKQAFTTGGIIAGLKAIGATLLDVILMPLQQILRIVANFTGFEWAQNAVKGIEKLRSNLGVNVTTDESGNPLNQTEAINTRATQQQAERSRNNELVNRLTGNITVRNESSSQVESDSDFLKVVTTPTYLSP